MVLSSCSRRRGVRPLPTFTPEYVGSCSLAPLLRWSAQEKAFLVGQHLHNQVVGRGLEENTFVANLVLQMYCACGALGDAVVQFARMDVRNEYTWRIMIVGNVNHGRPGDALELFQDMQAGGIVADRLTFITIITVCQVHLSVGKRVHYLVMARNLESDLVIGNALITMYAKNDYIEDARAIFNQMRGWDVVSWNAIITAYSSQGQWVEAIELLNMMRQNKFTPDRLTFIAILTAFTSQSALDHGIRVHKLLLTSKYKDDVAVNNALVNMYVNCGSPTGALLAFESMSERDIITWTTIIAVYAQHNESNLVFQCYEQLQQECVAPNIVTSIKYFDVCTTRRALSAGKRMHARVASYTECSEIIAQTVLLTMYGRCECLQSSRAIFDNMSLKNIITWGAMVSVYSHLAFFMDTIQLLEQLLQEGNIPDTAILVSILESCASTQGLRRGQQVHSCAKFYVDEPLCAALVKMYAKHNCLEDAEYVFHGMSEHSILSWSAKIVSYSQLEQNQMVLQHFKHMHRESVMLDKVTFVSIITVCGMEMDLLSGKKLHVAFQSSELQFDVFLWNALVIMYGRCGDTEEAQKVFDKIPQTNEVSWNSLMTAYAQNGHCGKARKVFFEMEKRGISLGKATFSILLSACSHGGLISEAFYYYQFMGCVHGAEHVVDHYNCLIDLLARAGLLGEAEILLKEMPCTPNIVSLVTVLGACRHLNDVGRGERIMTHIFHLDPSNAIAFVMLSNIYASSENHTRGIYEMLEFIEGIT